MNGACLRIDSARAETLVSPAGRELRSNFGTRKSAIVCENFGPGRYQRPSPNHQTELGSEWQSKSRHGVGKTLSPARHHKQFVVGCRKGMANSTSTLHKRIVHQRGVPKLEDGPILGIGGRKLVRVRFPSPRLSWDLTQIRRCALVESWRSE